MLNNIEPVILTIVFDPLLVKRSKEKKNNTENGVFVKKKIL